MHTAGPSSFVWISIDLLFGFKYTYEGSTSQKFLVTRGLLKNEQSALLSRREKL